MVLSVARTVSEMSDAATARFLTEDQRKERIIVYDEPSYGFVSMAVVGGPLASLERLFCPSI